MVCEAEKEADQSRETTWQDLPTEIKENIFELLRGSFLAELRLLNKEAFQIISSKVFRRFRDSRSPETWLPVCYGKCFYDSDGKLFHLQSYEVEQLDTTFKDSTLLQVSSGLMLLKDKDEDNCFSLRVHNPLTKTSRSLPKLRLNDMAANGTYNILRRDTEIIANIEDGTYEVVLIEAFLDNEPNMLPVSVVVRIYSSLSRSWTLCCCPLKFARETSFLFFNYKLYCVSDDSTLCYDLETENVETIQRFFTAGTTTARPFHDSWQFPILYRWKRIHYSRKCMYLAVFMEDYLDVFKFVEEDRSWEKMKLTRIGETPNETKIQWDEKLQTLWFLGEFEEISCVTSRRQTQVPCRKWYFPFYINVNMTMQP